MKTKLLIVAAVIAIGLVGALSAGATGKVLPINTPIAGASCPNPPITAQFNPYPTEFSGDVNCTDLPTLSGKVNNGAYPQNQAERLAGVTAHAGDEVTVRVYVHNGAATNLDPDQTTAFHTTVIVTVPNDVARGRTLAATIQANYDSSITLNDNMRITTNSDERVEIIPGSGTVVDHNGHVVQSGLLNSTTQQTINLGDMLACYDHLRVITYKVRVIKVTTPTPTPTPSKTPKPTPTPTPSPVAINCTIGNAPNRTIFRFPNPDQNYLLANGTNAQAIVGPYNFGLAAGTYRVTLQAFDDHTEHPSQNQPNEQFQVVLKRVYESRLATSNASPDIADNAAYSMGDVGTITIAEAATTITAIHAFYGSSNPNSLTPVCAAFDLISVQGTPRLTIQKTAYNPALQNPVYTELLDTTPGQRVAFRLIVTNTGSATATNVIVRDILPTNLSYEQGSTNQPGGTNYGDGIITSQGLNIGDIEAGQMRTIVFGAFTAGANEFPVGTTTRTNTGYAKADGVAEISDTASVRVTKENTTISAPTISTSCVNNTAKATISWSEANRGSAGYYIDIDNDNNWGNGHWNKFVASGTTSTTTDGFTFIGGGSTLVLASNTTYQVRVYYVATSEHSPVASFTTQNCNPAGTPSLEITKLVRNISQNSGESDTVAARPSEIVEFSIRVKNTGNANATNVRVWDSLPAGLTYQTGSSTHGDGIVTSDINIGTLTPNQIVTIRFRATTREDAYFSNGTTTLTNTANANADGLNTVNDKAFVQVTKSHDATLVCYIATPNIRINEYAYVSATGGNGNYSWFAGSGNPVNGSGSTFTTRFSNAGTFDIRLTDTAGQSTSCRVYVADDARPTVFIDKLARNVSANSGEMNTVSARPNETIEFILRVTTSGNTTATNIRVWDNLPAGLRYLNGTTTVDGNGNYGDSITTGGITIGSAYGARTFTVRFQARVEDVYSASYITYTNIAYTSADNAGTQSDTAYVNVNRDNGGNNPTYQLVITKTGRNISKGEVQIKNTVNAAPNDTLEFFINVRSTAGVVLNNVIIRDVLPANLQYINNTTSINNNATLDGIVAGGINVGTLNPGQEVTIRFNAVVRPQEYFAKGVTPLTNIAYTKADNAAEISAQMPINIYNGSVLPQAGIPKGGANLLVLALALGAALTLVYMAYTKTGFFKNREALAIADRSRTSKDKFNFAG